MPTPDEIMMFRALRLARRAWGMTSPNPMVGAVLCKDGRIIGEGYHHRAGMPHAEIEALRSCQEPPAGATCHVTLEPCSTHGRTPPCVDALIAAKVAEVVVGCLDPNPAHAGRGVELLRSAGIAVRTGVLREKCAELNEAFFHWITTRTPFVLLKMAITLDGKIATRSGSSKWITGPAARARVQRLRRWADAILVGGETARLDKPSLTVRGVANWPQPRRLVATRSLTAADLAGLLPVGVPPEPLGARGADEWRLELARLGAENVTALLVEGGGELASSLLRANLVDKVEFHIAPKLLGGRGSRPALGGADPASLDEALGLERVKTCRAGDDLIVSGYPRRR